MRTLAIETAIVLVLGIAVVVTGLWVVKTKHESRGLFAELQELIREEDRLQLDWNRLKIEQGALGVYARIETLARDELGLQEPAADQVQMVAESAP